MKKPKVTPSEIKAARQKANLTQTEAAALIGYTKRAWQDWEGAKRGMRKALFDQFLEKVKPT